MNYEHYYNILVDEKYKLIVRINDLKKVFLSGANDHNRNEIANEIENLESILEKIEKYLIYVFYDRYSINKKINSLKENINQTSFLLKTNKISSSYKHDLAINRLKLSNFIEQIQLGILMNGNSNPHIDAYLRNIDDKMNQLDQKISDIDIMPHYYTETVEPEYEKHEQTTTTEEYYDQPNYNYELPEYNPPIYNDVSPIQNYNSDMYYDDDVFDTSLIS